MRTSHRHIPSCFGLWIVAALCWAVPGPDRAVAQELEPGAYSPSPKDFNILIGALTYNTGELAFDPTGPLDNGNADIGVGTVGYIRTLGIWGRLANIGYMQPYVRGDVRGDAFGEYQEVSRSGFADPRIRFAVNLHGGPA